MTKLISNLNKLVPNIRPIKLRGRTVINADLLRDRTRRFFKNEKFDSRFIALITKIRANNDSFWRSIDRRTIIDTTNFTDVSNYINKMIRYTNSHIEDWYDGIKPDYLQFEWINATEKDYVVYQNNLKIANLYKNLDIKIDNPHNLPYNINYKTWGKILLENKNELIIRDELRERTYTIRFLRDLVEIQMNTKYNIYYFEDVIITTAPIYQFKRIFIKNNSNYEYFYENNQLILKIIDKKVNTLQPIKKDIKYNCNIITLDIETIVINNKHIPYLICFYDGKDKYSFYLSDYASEKEMFKACIESLLKPKYSGFSVYAHNLSHFDGIFLFNE